MADEEKHQDLPATGNAPDESLRDALRVSEERFRAAVQAIGTLWTNNGEGQMVGEQPGWAALTGQSYEEYQGHGWADAVHPEDAQPTIDAWNEAVRERKTFLFRHRVRQRDGEWRLFVIRAVPVLTEEGDVREWVGVHVDVTEEAERESVLREEEAQYRQIAEGLPQLVWSAGPDGVRDYFNRRWIEFTGVALETDPNPWRTALHEEDRDRALSAWWEAIGAGHTFQAEYRLRGRDGHYRWYLGRAIAIRNEHGEIVRWFGTCTDIHDQKVTQNVLEVTNAFAISLAQDLDLERIVQSLTDASTSAIGAEFGSFFYTVKGESGEAFLLYTLSGAPIEAFSKFGLPRATPVFGPTFRGEGIVRSEDITKDPRYGQMGAPHHGMPKGHLPVVSYLAVPVISRGSEVVGGLFFGHSHAGMFTEEHERIVASFAAQAAVAIDNARLYDQVRIANEELEHKVQVRSADLLSAVEQLQGFTYHVSHDLRAPLRAIGATSQIILQDYGDDLPAEVKTLLARQTAAAAKLGLLVDDLLKLSRLSRQEMVKRPVDITSLAEEATAEALSTHPYSTVEVVIAPGLQAEGDPLLLRLALMNLVENAVKYSPGGGLVQVGQAEGGAFFVRDEGIGMDPQYLSKIFEPFERLHRDEEFSGTGIGLANARQVFERHGGRLWAETEPGRGSTFFFTLPDDAGESGQLH